MYFGMIKIFSTKEVFGTYYLYLYTNQMDITKNEWKLALILVLYYFIYVLCVFVTRVRV